jgi:putative component of membrane protein insertase Oxa1/YidC/SpoIIIJ protein YidD
MPSLRKPIVQIRWLLIGLASFFIVDALLPPKWEPTAWGAVACIDAYQFLGRPVSRRYVLCRFTPTCSDYSKQAFLKYGFWHGLVKTIDRVSRCTSATPLGTYDPP